MGAIARLGWMGAECWRGDRAALLIRAECAGDADGIRALTSAAFEGAPHSGGNEAEIVDGLRAAGALTLSLVAERDAELIGHAAFSPVTIGGGAEGWFGLGPLSVRPDAQRGGVGAALIRRGLDALRQLGASGCVVLGDPGYYARFGFRSVPGLRFGDVPQEIFQALAFSGPPPRGMVVYHPAFGAAEEG